MTSLAYAIYSQKRILGQELVEKASI